MFYNGGESIDGYIGGHDTAFRPRKVPHTSGKSVIKIQAGGNSQAFLSADGQITILGRLYDGGFGVRTVEVEQKFVDISMSRDDFWTYYILALTDDNRLFAFGQNYCGQCGQGSTGDFINEPVEVKGLDNLRIKELSTDKSHCLIKCSKI